MLTISFYTIEDLNSHASGVLFICFNGNVTRKWIQSGGHRRCPYGFKSSRVYNSSNNHIKIIMLIR